MPRKHAGGWHWDDDEHIRALADCLRRKLRAHQIAEELNRTFRAKFPEMALVPNSIVSALRNKGVPKRLEELFPEEVEELIKEFKRHKPGPGRIPGTRVKPRAPKPKPRDPLPPIASGIFGRSRPR